MGEAALLLERVLVGAAALLLMLGVVTAWASTNGLRRVIGVIISGLGALLALASLEAPSGALAGGVALLFAYLAVGAALIVRAQEAYGGIELNEIDMADAEAGREQR